MSIVRRRALIQHPFPKHQPRKSEVIRLNNLLGGNDNKSWGGKVRRGGEGNEMGDPLETRGGWIGQQKEIPRAEGGRRIRGKGETVLI